MKEAAPTAKARLDKITTDGLCIGCGICQSMAGVDQVALKLQSNGVERPVVDSQVSHDLVDAVYSVCPSTRVTANINAPHLDLIWGGYEEMYLSWAAAPEIRHRGSTGGLLTALTLYLFESGTADFILHAKQHSQIPSFGEACISTTANDVIEASGSRYGPTATLIDIQKIVGEAAKAKQKFAFIGTPCDVSALRNYAKRNPEVDRTCIAMLTMVCGGFMAPQTLDEFLRHKKIDVDRIESIRYRGFGCPGDTVIQFEDGSSHRFTYLDFWGEDESAWGLPSRCKICPDGIGESADIAASDTWEGGSPTVSSLSSDRGSNAAVVRTEVGKQLMDAAIQAGYLVRGATLTPADMNRFQPHQEKKKRALPARLKAMSDKGLLTPETTNLRLDELARENSEEFQHSEYRGTVLRIDEGKFSEPVPRD